MYHRRRSQGVPSFRSRLRWFRYSRLLLRDPIQIGGCLESHRAAHLLTTVHAECRSGCLESETDCETAQASCEGSVTPPPQQSCHEVGADSSGRPSSLLCLSANGGGAGRAGSAGQAGVATHRDSGSAGHSAIRQIPSRPLQAAPRQHPMPSRQDSPMTRQGLLGPIVSPIPIPETGTALPPFACTEIQGSSAEQVPPPHPQQVNSAAQALPQAPQWLGSAATLTQRSPQQVRPRGQQRSPQAVSPSWQEQTFPALLARQINGSQQAASSTVQAMPVARQTQAVLASCASTQAWPHL
jgi:hypothetical protein